ncbi:hypothetical protein UPYG_G00135930 [Umbra pygmaea]|uniref:PHD-type domain-containing protein n=1 Tax=Umbra pygmaea TaxID=75934 RepID=A0ABD0WU71_UMBPY
MFERKKLPPRSGRGTRLEAIVMNINPNWYKVSIKKPRAPKTQAQPLTKPKTQTQSSTSKAAVIPNKPTSFLGKKRVLNKTASSSEGETTVKTAKRKAATLTKPCIDSYIDGITVDCFRETTSDSEHASFSKYPDNSASPKTSILPFPAAMYSEKQYEYRESSSEVDVVGSSTPSKVSDKSPGKQKAKNKGSKAASHTTKPTKAPASKKKRKKPRPCQSSMFSPKEPEIRLRYVSYKEEKKDVRGDTFSPFIHVERKPCATSTAKCTVINYPEEAKPNHKKGVGQHQTGGCGSFVTGAVPSTSCLQLGRISTQSKYHSPLVCCLCGCSANAMDLGDLHGPYYPEGYRPSSKAPASSPGLTQEVGEEFSDSDSSCSARGRGRKCARPPGVPWPQKPGPRLNQEGLLGRWTSNGAPSDSPPAKRARTHARAEVGVPSGAAVEDWYSAPVVPLEQCEYWLHEDCGVWAAGVFLVKGRIYGLEEAVMVAQERMCSRCHKPGATLGCVLKGCQNKYHYRCCLQSECVLNEENFSMKCNKHKNKSFKCLPGSRRVDR